MQWKEGDPVKSAQRQEAVFIWHHVLEGQEKTNLKGRLFQYSEFLNYVYAP